MSFDDCGDVVCVVLCVVVYIINRIGNSGMMFSVWLLIEIGIRCMFSYMLVMVFYVLVMLLLVISNWSSVIVVMMFNVIIFGLNVILMRL